MKIIHPYHEEIAKVTCSCGCDDFMQFNRWADVELLKNETEQEELYSLDLKKDSEKWPFKLKFTSLWDMIINIKSYKNGENQYCHSHMMNKKQAEKLYDTLIQDIENFDEQIADFILQGLEDFVPIDEKVNEYTKLIGNFNCDLMWIGVDGADLKSPPNPEEGFYPHDVVIGWRLAESVNRKDLLRFWRHYLKTGSKYEITEFDAVLGKEDIVVILGSIKYMLSNIFKKPEVTGVIKL